MTARPYFADSFAYNPADVIRGALERVAAGQGADRVGVRALHVEGGAVLAGVYDGADLDRAAADIAALEAAGCWHLYTHVQPVVAPITGRLLPGSRGTVTTRGIGAYAVFPVDIDPGPTGTPATALQLARELVALLVRLGAERRSIMLMQSGRGAYALVAHEPQPLTVRPTIRAAMRSLATLADRVDAGVSVDAGVHDPPRIVRIGGTTNRKPDADPALPCWILDAWTPGVRSPWSVIERLAVPSRPKLQVVPGGRTAPRADAAARTPLRELFERRGWLRGERPGGICDVRCPQADRHSDGRDEAILYPPREPGGPGWVRCLHAHCDAMALADVYAALEAR